MSSRLFFIFFAFLFVLSACVPEPETAVTPTPPPAPTLPTATAVPPTATEPATSTPQTTPQPPTATPKAVPTLPPSPTANIPADLQVISPENAGQLTQLAQFGNGRIDSLTWSPDGATFAVGSSQGIDFYNSQTLQLSQTIRDEQIGGTIHVRLSPSGKFLIITMGGGEMDRVTLWDVHSGRYLRDLFDAFFTDFSPDDSIVYFEWGSQQVVWQDPHTGENSRTIALTYFPLAFNLASETIVEYHDSGLRFHDMTNGQVRYTLETSDSTLTFSPKGDVLATSGTDDLVTLWDGQSGELRHELEGQKGWVDRVLFSPDGRILATSNTDKTIHLWDTNSGQLLHQMPWQSGCDNYGILAFSPDGQELAVVSGNKLLFFSVADGSLQRTLDNGYCLTTEIDLVFSADNNTLMIASGANVHTLALPGGQLLQTVKTDSPVTSLAVSGDGQRMVWGGGTDRIWLQLWDLPTNQPLYTVTEGGGAIHKVAFSPDDRLLTAQSGPWEAPLVELRATDSGELVASYPANTFAFTPDGRFLATATTPYAPETGGIALWDTTTFQLVRRFDQLELLAISPNGNLLATENYAGIITSWWNLESGEQLHPLSPPEELIAVPTFNPDGRLLLATTYYSHLVILDTANGQSVWGLAYGQSGVFSRDGRYLATVSMDGIVRLWGVPSRLP